MMKRLLILLLAIGFGTAMYAQKGSNLQKRGDIQFRNFNFEKATRLYTKALDKNPELYASMEKLAESYRLMNDWPNAEKWYGELVKIPGAKPEFFYYYAQALRSNSKYEMAKTYFDEYAAMNSDPAFSPNIAMDMDDIETLMNKKSRFTVRNASEINSESDEFGPIFYGDGIAFTSNRTGETFVRNEDLWTQAPFLQMYVAEADENGNLTGKVDPIEGKNNGKFHDGPAAFSADENVMYLTRNNYLKRKPTKGADKTVGLKLYELKKGEGGEWGSISEEFPFNSDDYSVAHAAISTDGNYIVFTSDAPKAGARGGNDLYITKKNGESWGPMENLGEEINTLGDEMFPYIANDGTLYFASNGHPGLGGLDIYEAKKSGDGWADPQNLGAPVNTSMDDFNMIVSENGLFGYFASNRADGMGGDDIYYVDIEPQGEIDLIVSVFETKPNDTYKELMEGATVTLTNLYDNSTKEVVTDRSGKVEFSLERNKQYQIKAEKDPPSENRQYLTTSKTVSTVGVIPPKTLEEDLLLMLTELDQPIELENIYYDLDKWFIRSDAKPDLDYLVKVMKDNPNITIELGSHTDCRASFEYNIELSAKRAEAAVRYLIKNGISGKRLLAAGYGETQLVNDCECENKVGKGRTDACTDEMHQDNRRTEFKILSR